MKDSTSDRVVGELVVELVVALGTALVLWALLATQASGLRQAAAAPTGEGLVVAWQLALAAAAALVGGSTALAVAAVSAARRGDTFRGVVVLRRGLPALATALLAGLLYVDARLFTAQAMHLDASFVQLGLRAGNGLGESNLGAMTFVALAGAIGAFALGNAALRVLALRMVGGAALQPRATAPRIMRWIAVTAGVALLATTLFTATQASRALRSGDPVADALFLAERLLGAGESVGHLALDHPGAAAADALAADPRLAAQKRPDVLLLLVESWRGDALDPRWMPALSALAASLPCLRSERHYAGSHATVWSVFTLLFGVDAFLFEPVAEANVASTPLAMLGALGYQRTGISASQLRGWDHGDRVIAGLDHYDEVQGADVPARDRAVIRGLLGRLATKRERPTLAFGFLYAPHHNYHFPPEFERFLPVLPLSYNHFAPDDQLAEHAEEIRNRYRNAVAFVDAEIAGLLKALRPRIESGELIVFVSGDHGEEFWDHGAVGHGAARFWDARTAVPLLFCGLQLANRRVRLSSHVDIMPTLLDLLGVTETVPTARWSTGHSLLRQSQGPVVVSGVGYPWRGKGLAQVQIEGGARVKRWFERGSDALAPTQVRRSDANDDDMPDSVDTAARDAEASATLRRRLGRFLRRDDAVSTARPEGLQTLHAQFGGLIALDGVAVAAIPARAGGHGRVEFAFRRLPGAAAPQDVQLFCHLVALGTPSKLLRNLDHVPVDGQLPLALWPVDGWVRDVVHVPFGGALAAGTEIGLVVGFYRPQSGRLEVKVDPGVQVIDRGVVVARWRL